MYPTSSLRNKLEVPCALFINHIPFLHPRVTNFLNFVLINLWYWLSLFIYVCVLNSSYSFFFLYWNRIRVYVTHFSLNIKFLRYIHIGVSNCDSFTFSPLCKLFSITLLMEKALGYNILVMWAFLYKPLNSYVEEFLWNMDYWVIVYVHLQVYKMVPNWFLKWF